MAQLSVFCRCQPFDIEAKGSWPVSTSWSHFTRSLLWILSIVFHKLAGL